MDGVSVASKGTRPARLELRLQYLEASAWGPEKPRNQAGWWNMAASHLSSLEDRMVAMGEKLKDVTSAHNALVNATEGASAERARRTEMAVETLQQEVQRIVEEGATMQHSEALAMQAKEQLKTQTSELKQLLCRWESTFETLRSQMEAEASFRINGETKRREDSEKLLSSLLGDLGELRREFNKNTEATARAAQSGLIRWGRG
ncbi:unnamed protein product [Effrenium voratum]|nr:unnamed protein product [Effrenium voratum]